MNKIIGYTTWIAYEVSEYPWLGGMLAGFAILGIALLALLAL